MFPQTTRGVTKLTNIKTHYDFWRLGCLSQRFRQTQQAKANHWHHRGVCGEWDSFTLLRCHSRAPGETNHVSWRPAKGILRSEARGLFEACRHGDVGLLWTPNLRPPNLTTGGFCMKPAWRDSLERDFWEQLLSETKRVWEKDHSPKLIPKKQHWLVTRRLFQTSLSFCPCSGR